MAKSSLFLSLFDVQVRYVAIIEMCAHRGKLTSLKLLMTDKSCTWVVSINRRAIHSKKVLSPIKCHFVHRYDKRPNYVQKENHSFDSPSHTMYVSCVYVYASCILLLCLSRLLIIALLVSPSMSLFVKQPSEKEKRSRTNCLRAEWYNRLLP